jgi:hypothetical protein
MTKRVVPCSSIVCGLKQEGVNAMFKKLDAGVVLSALDSAKISNEGWRDIFSQLKSAAADARLKLKVHSTANPHQVKAAKVMLDNQCKSALLSNIAVDADVIELNLDEMIEIAVACSISSGVLKPSQLREDGVVKVMLTLDETCWAGDKKLERVCLKIMNQMLASPTEVPVQSEFDVYPLMMFFVAKEDHQVLKANLQGVNEHVKAFNAGRKLAFPGVTTDPADGLPVECHLSADLKTVHAVYNVSNSPSAKSQNAYDTHLKAERPSILDRVAAGELTFTMDDIRGFRDSADAALDIPLDRVHFCSLHGEMRLVEALLNRLINDAWNLTHTDGGSSDLRTRKLEQITGVLRRMGVYGGRVEIREDVKRTAKHGMAPTRHKQISLNGTMCRTLLDYNDGDWYRSLILALNPSPRRRAALTALWGHCRKVCGYLRARFLTAAEIAAWPKIIADFLASFKACYGTAYTKYMYILGTVAGAFMETYGAVSIWNAQALEKSHWRAKCLYLSKTNKGGGKVKQSPLYQLTLVTFRTMMHRMRQAQGDLKLRMFMSGEGLISGDSASEEPQVGAWSTYLQKVVDMQVERNTMAVVQQRLEGEESLIEAMLEREVADVEGVEEDEPAVIHAA